MPLLYRSADVFLHLSKDESSPLAFLEAMACGLPVVTHDLPRMRWIVGDDEFLLDTENSARIAQQIELAANAGPAQRQKRAMKAGASPGKILPKNTETFCKKPSHHLAKEKRRVRGLRDIVIDNGSWSSSPSRREIDSR